MKPVTPFDNFPSFGNAGARQAPGDAKYAQGFLAADTLPAEWANYFFHGSTKGISDLNTAVRSIWLELSSVLTAYNITADASQTDQLYLAIEKRLSSLYPVGTVYQNADSNKNPGDSDMLGFGTWEPITDKFLAARGSTNIGESGGAWIYTLAEANIPQHSHYMNHVHYTNISHTHTINDPGHVHDFAGGSAVQDSDQYADMEKNYHYTGANSAAWGWHKAVLSAPTGITINNVSSTDQYKYSSVSIDEHAVGGMAYTHTWGTANPTAISLIPTYVGVYTWKRTA